MNARITERSFDRWQIFPSFAKQVFANISLYRLCKSVYNNVLYLSSAFDSLYARLTPNYIRHPYIKRIYGKKMGERYEIVCA